MKVSERVKAGLEDGRMQLIDIVANVMMNRVQSISQALSICGIYRKKFEPIK